MTLENAISILIEATTYEVVIQRNENGDCKEMYFKSKPNLREAIQRWQKMEELTEEARTEQETGITDIYEQKPESYIKAMDLCDAILTKETAIDTNGDRTTSGQADPCYAGGLWYIAGKLQILVCPNRDYWDAEIPDAKDKRAEMLEAWSLIDSPS